MKTTIKNKPSRKWMSFTNEILKQFDVWRHMQEIERWVGLGQLPEALQRQEQED